MATAARRPRRRELIKMTTIGLLQRAEICHRIPEQRGRVDLHLGVVHLTHNEIIYTGGGGTVAMYMVLCG